MIRSLPLAAAVLFALGTLASTTARADDDKFVVRVGGMHAKAESQLTGRTVFDGTEYDYTSDRYELGEKTVPRVEAMFRLGNRHRLLGNYFRYNERNRETLGEDVSFGDTTFPAGSFAELETEFDLASLMYDFALVESDTFSFGLQIGVQSASLTAGVRAESGTDTFFVRERERGTAAVVGARIGTNSADGKWRFTAQGQYLDADWGDFEDYDGDISRANALVEYRFTKNFGLYAGYDWFKLNVRQTGSEGTIGLDQRFRGPIAGVTFAF